MAEEATKPEENENETVEPEEAQAEGAEDEPQYDRVVESTISEPPEIDDRLFNVMIAALKEAKEKLEAGEEVVPFTALGVKDKLFLETHPGGSSDQCFAEARHTVQNVSGADAYALCYDGYVDTDEGTKDVLIAEGGVPGEDNGYAIGYVYEVSDEEGKAPVVNDEPVYIGPAPNFMQFTKPIVLDEEDEAEEEAEDVEEAADEVAEEEAEAAETAEEPEAPAAEK